MRALASQILRGGNVSISYLDVSGMELRVYFEKGIITGHEAEGGVVSYDSGSASTYQIALHELAREWPEVYTISVKLIMGKDLSERERHWVEELAEASGWDASDMVDEMRSLAIDPSERAERYRDLFEKYYREAWEHKKRGDLRQAGEKIWGAVTALIKLYAANKGIPIIHWSIGKLDRFIESNVEKEYRKLFRDLLDKARILHEHFYEGNLSSEGFEERWKEVMELLQNARKTLF